MHRIGPRESARWAVARRDQTFPWQSPGAERRPAAQVRSGVPALREAAPERPRLDSTRQSLTTALDHDANEVNSRHAHYTRQHADTGLLLDRQSHQRAWLMAALPSRVDDFTGRKV